MYESFYGLRERPFSLLPDPQFLFESRQHRAVLSRLVFAVENRTAVSVLTGPPGTGKTTLLRALMRHLPGNVTVGLITNTHESFSELLHWILAALAIPCDRGGRVERIEALRAFLHAEKAKGRRVLLILDEAQNLPGDAIEELRMLADIGADGMAAFEMILAGQPELGARLARPEFAAFAQRVGVSDRTGTLGAEDTAAYIQHRTRVAGAARPIFEPRACRAIHRHTKGNPRLINLLCDLCLVYGYAEDTDTIGARIVEDVLRERARHGNIPAFHDTEVLSGRDDDEPRRAAMRKGDREAPQKPVLTASGNLAKPDETKVHFGPGISGESTRTMDPLSMSPIRVELAPLAKRPIVPMGTEKLSSNSSNRAIAGAFAAGLVAAGLLAGISYYVGSAKERHAPVAPPISRPSAATAIVPPVPADAPEVASEVARLKAEMLERERDTALERVRALERERDAAIEAARAATLARIARSEATRARLEKGRAAEIAARANEETARALEQLRAAQEQAARERAAAEHAMRALESAVPPVTGQPAPTPAPAPALPPTPAEPRRTSPGETDTATGFSTNPCKGPSARFLSTCKNR
jgi:type II secretory pathway predicted ATPase ExeA